MNNHNLVDPSPDKIKALYDIVGPHWQPIAEAPTDTPVLLFSPDIGSHGIVVGLYSTAVSRWLAGCTDNEGPICFIAEFTHWMPMPPPPGSN